MKKVIIFRNQLFKPSETFITQQAESLQSFQPIYLGRERLGEGPTNSISLTLSDKKEYSSFPQKHLQIATRHPSYYFDLIKEYRPSLIHAHFGVDGLAALPLARKLDIPLITTFHGFDATIKRSSLIFSGSPSWINYALFYKQLISQGHLFICVSNFIQKKLLSLGFPEEKTIVHYIGVDIKKITPVKNQQKPLKKVLHVARLVEKKGTEYLIRAFAEIVDKDPTTQLVIIGNGPLRKNLERISIQMKLEKNIFFLGEKNHLEVLRQLGSASIFCLPSVTSKKGDMEGLGMVLLEASASGIPIVGTNHGGIVEVIEDGLNGYLVPEKNIKLISKRINEILSDTDLHRALGNNARSFVAQKFNLTKQTEKLEKIYIKLGS